MKRLEWSVQYSVGVPQLDRQHAYLFELANLLAKHLDDQNILRETIDKLHLYVNEHFAFEETMMEKAHYEHLEEHRKMHALMRTRLEFLTAQLKQGLLHRGELITFMEDWLTIHILREDMKYIPAVSAMAQ